MRIARDGTWYYQESPIQRERMVKLFSTILLREGDAYFLVTPVEKLRIKVDDAPFVATDVERVTDGDREKLVFTTNVGTHVVAGARIRYGWRPTPTASRPPICISRQPGSADFAQYLHQLVDWARREEQGGGARWWCIPTAKPSSSARLVRPFLPGLGRPVPCLQKRASGS